MTDNSCVILGVSRSLALTLHSFPRWGNYANMTSVDFAWVVCLNMLSFVAHIHVLFLPALYSRVEAIANLINYDTNATGFFGSSGPLRDSSALWVLFGILRLFGSSSGFSLRMRGLGTHTATVTADTRHAPFFRSRSFYGYPFVLSTNQNEPPPQLNGDY